MRLLLALVGVCGWGATVTVGAKCAQSITEISGPEQQNARCGDFSTLGQATASAFRNGPFYSLDATAANGIAGPLGGLTAEGTATFDATFLITITGGTGFFRLQPCYTAQAVANGPGAAAAASAIFGDTQLDIPQNGNCAITSSQLYAFDVPIPIHISLTAVTRIFDSLVGGAHASIALTSLWTIDSQTGDRNQAHFTASELTPEPQSAALALLGAAAIGLLVTKRRVVSKLSE